MARDDAGVIQVVEAILVAVLVLSGLLFFSLTTRAPLPQGVDSTDLHQVADDLMIILESAKIEDPAQASRKMVLEEWVSEIVAGDAHGRDVADAVERYIRDNLPVGLQFLVRLDNGAEPIVLVPEAAGDTSRPRTAAVALSHIVPDWDEWQGNSLAGTFAPGQLTTVDGSGFGCVGAPDGNTTAPQSSTWATHWGIPTSTDLQVPQTAVAGVWAFDAACPINTGSATFIQVSSPNGLTSDTPAYGIQLVVWRGA